MMESLGMLNFFSMVDILQFLTLGRKDDINIL